MDIERGYPRGLIDLPCEIREMIYRKCLPEGEVLDIKDLQPTHISTWICPSRLNILCLDKFITKECIGFIYTKIAFVLELEQDIDCDLQLCLPEQNRLLISHLVVSATLYGPSYLTSSPNDITWKAMLSKIKTLDIIIERPGESENCDEKSLAGELSTRSHWIKQYLQVIANSLPLTAVIQLDCGGVRKTMELCKDHLGRRFTEQSLYFGYIVIHRDQLVWEEDSQFAD
ncbi:hypothetical protein N7456_005339 [Penicillium angulare]|uniref:Uncharacterized protein n=1 Tax=Penicillium angulare TaxID=116970 RepID=A0A9W9FYC7_9EURO|nr:hypothetical protein N7456_005339 [Penicillium angulare]